VNSDPGTCPAWMFPAPSRVPDSSGSQVLGSMLLASLTVHRLSAIPVGAAA